MLRWMPSERNGSSYRGSSRQFHWTIQAPRRDKRQSMAWWTLLLTGLQLPYWLSKGSVRSSCSVSWRLHTEQESCPGERWEKWWRTTQLKQLVMILSLLAYTWPQLCRFLKWKKEKKIQNLTIAHDFSPIRSVDHVVCSSHECSFFSSILRDTFPNSAMNNLVIGYFRTTFSDSVLTSSP